jgi:hypothetical protein
MMKASQNPPARAFTADSPLARSDEMRPLEVRPSAATAMAADTRWETVTTPKPTRVAVGDVGHGNGEQQREVESGTYSHEDHGEEHLREVHSRRIA